MKTLNRHLVKAGFGDLPYAFVFEWGPNTRGDYRLHLHGVLGTAPLSAEEMMGLRRVLCSAAGEAVGCLGGDRQLDLRVVNTADGWADYMMKNRARIKRLLGVDVPYMMNRHMTRAARQSYEDLRDAQRGRCATKLRA